MSDEAFKAGPRSTGTSPLVVHLLAGVPTSGVRSCFESLGDLVPVIPLGELGDASLGESSRACILVPPSVEPSLIVERWLQGSIMDSVFRRPAHLAGISTFLDVDEVLAQVATTALLSECGWGQGEFDRRTLADIVVGQIESARRLVLVGASPPSESLLDALRVLNPGASRAPIREGSQAEMIRFADQLEGHLGDHEVRCGESPSQMDRLLSQPTTVVPPWQKVLQGECSALPGHLAYRRARPFDPEKLENWLLDPPPGILRAKGRLWFADEPDQSFGYSCAGSVHRVFPAGRWWASSGTGAWPGHIEEQRRLLAQWHPRFGDRRQELVFGGLNLDADELVAGLDDCLLPEDAVEEAFSDLTSTGLEPFPLPSARIH